jgi:predicted aconitase with swiveling domain
VAAKLVLKASRAFGPELEGEALVSRDSIHFILDVARETGLVVGVKHDLYGKNITDKILVLPTAKGGVLSAMAIAELMKNGCCPKALVYIRTNPIMVHGAIMINIPIMDSFDQNPVETIRSGDWVRVKPAEGIVEVERKRPF